jgi:hypothetical protein
MSVGPGPRRFGAPANACAISVHASSLTAPNCSMVSARTPKEIDLASFAYATVDARKYALLPECS